MTVKILAIGDPHSKVSNQEDLRACADRIVPIIEAERPDAVVILGDLANDHEKVYVTALNGMAYFMGRILETRIKVGKKLYYLVGNHDFVNNQQFLTEEHALNVFKPWQSLVIVDKPVRFKTPLGYIVMCPYVPPGRFNEAVAPMLDAPVLAVMCHQEFLGAELGAIPSKIGDKWPDAAPLTISGHIHKNSSPQPNVRYVGAPFDHSFGEEGDKTISLFEFDGTGMTERTFDLGLPKKITVECDATAALAYQVPGNARVRMVLSVTTEEYAKLRKNEQFAQLAQAVKIIPNITDKVTIRSADKRRGYVDILREECQKEGELVRAALEGILSESNS